MSTGPLSDPITLRLPLDVLEPIETIAKTCDRTRSWVMVRALRQYLATEGREILDVAAGMRELEAGDSVDMDDAIAQMERIIRGNAA